MTTATASTPDVTPGAVPLAAVVPLSDLYPSPSNPRKHFEDLGELALSLSRKGVEIPLIVRTRETAQGRLEIVDGERRYRAAQQAGLQFVPVIQRDTMSDADVLELQLENAMQRSDLTPLEEARGIKALLKSAAATPAEIAKRMSRSERFIADRLRLLDLVPELQSLLDQDRIGVEHADRLAKLTKEDQRRALDPGGDRGRAGGLWAPEGRTLDFDELNDTPDRTRDPYAGLKAVTVKELDAWIARHVRFDVERMATTAPLEFGRVKGQIDLAAAQPGRGKKVVEITHDHHLADEVRDPAKRVYGPRSWKRADGTVASSWDDRGKAIDSPTCDASVLGVVSIGPEYGTAFQVCLARDTCTVHWGKEIRAKKRQTSAAAGQGAKATAPATTARESYDAQRKREAAERQAANALYRQLYPELAAAITAAIPSAVSQAALAYLWAQCTRGDAIPKDVTTPDALVRRLVADELKGGAPRTTEDTYTSYVYQQRRLLDLGAQFGVDAKALLATAKKALAAEVKAAEQAKKADAKQTAAVAKAVARVGTAANPKKAAKTR